MAKSKRPTPATIARLVGQVTIQWNNVQFEFFTITRALLWNQARLAHAAFFSIRTDRAQRDLLLALSEERLGAKSPIHGLLKTVVEKANKLAGRRNDVLHAMWNYTSADLKELRIFLPLHNRLQDKDIVLELEKIIRDLKDVQAEAAHYLEHVEEVLHKEQKRILAETMRDAAKALLPPDQGQAATEAPQQNGQKGTQRRKRSSRA